MQRILFVILGVIISVTTNAQVEKCDTEVLFFVEENINQLTPKQIKKFCLTFDKSCSLNIGYSEWSNELLFDVFDKHPKIMMRVISEGKTEIQIAAITHELATPLLDKVDVNKLIDKIQKIAGPDIDRDIKKKITDSLTLALKNQ